MSSATSTPAAPGAVRVGDVSDAELGDLVQERYRALSRAQAEVWEVMAEIGLRTGDGGRADGPVPSSIEEIGPALRLTSTAAFAEHDIAERLRVDLPAVGAALWAGELDRAKARAFVEWTRGLTEGRRAVIVEELLPGAAGWTVGQLVDRLRRRVRTLDPQDEKRRYDEARRARQVTASLTRDGTAVVAGSGLAPGSAAAAYKRTAHLARLIRHGGHPERVAQIQADVFAGLLDGSFAGMSDADVVAAVLDGAVPAGVPGVEVRVRLTTLAGLDEHDGELAGMGAVAADAAREVVARQHGGAWRFTLVDAAGRLLLTGATRHRPPGAAPTRPADRPSGVVELVVELADLLLLADAPPPGWERVLADLAEQWGRRDDLRAALDARPDDRFPSAALRRHVQVRDRTCRFPGCRCPAGRSQVDHTIEYQDGGVTVAGNVGLLCLRHHRLKSVGGWSLDQPAPGRFTWTSALGRSYRTGGEPSVDPPPF